MPLLLCAAGQPGGNETGDFTVVVQYHAPCVLPWVWDAVRPAGSGTLQTQPIALRAGAEGGSDADPRLWTSQIVDFVPSANPRPVSLINRHFQNVLIVLRLILTLDPGLALSNATS